MPIKPYSHDSIKNARRKFLHDLGLAGLSVPLISSSIKSADDK
jgi:hypothetical protein